MSETDHPITAACPACGERVPLVDFRNEGFLRARRVTDGGPYYELACSRCAAMLQLRWEPDGSRVVGPRPRTGILGQPRRNSPEVVQRFPPESPRERSEAAGQGAWPEEQDPGAEQDPPADRDPDVGPEFGPRRESGEHVDQLRAILGVDDGAGRDTILAAFRARSKRIHPDQFTNLDADFQALAHRKFIELIRARDCLLAIMDRRGR